MYKETVVGVSSFIAHMASTELGQPHAEADMYTLYMNN